MQRIGREDVLDEQQATTRGQPLPRPAYKSLMDVIIEISKSGNGGYALKQHTTQIAHW